MTDENVGTRIAERIAMTAMTMTSSHQSETLFAVAFLHFLYLLNFFQIYKVAMPFMLLATGLPVSSST